LKYANCSSADCTSKNVTVIDPSTGIAGPSVVVGNDGFARISYSVYNGNGDNYNENYVDCTNSSCSTTNTKTLSTLSGYDMNSIALGSDGYSRIIYDDPTNTTLIFTRLVTDSGANSVTGTSIGTPSNPFGALNVTTVNTTSDITAGGNVAFTATSAPLGQENITNGDFSTNPLALGSEQTTDGNFATDPVTTTGSELTTDGNFATNPTILGSEQTTDGNFTTDPTSTWTFDSSWAWDNTNHQVTHTPGTTTPLALPGALTSGALDVYQVSFDVVGGTAGTVTACLDDGTCSSAIAAGTGITTFNGRWSNSSGDIIIFTPSSDFDGSITNVSVKEESGWAFSDNSWTWDSVNHQITHTPGVSDEPLYLTWEL